MLLLLNITFSKCMKLNHYITKTVVVVVVLVSVVVVVVVVIYMYIKRCFGFRYYTENSTSQTAERPFTLCIPSPRTGRAFTVQHSNSILNSLCQCLNDGIW
jgi:hypothetical protein